MSKLTDYLDQDPTHHEELLRLDEGQIEALLDVVALAIYADGVIAVEEIEVFEEVARELPGLRDLSETELDARLHRARGHLQAITDPASASASLTGIAERLGDAPAREAAFGLAALIALSDGAVVRSEKNVLNRLALAFEIPTDRLQSIVDSARAFLAGR